jgi:hypothetical protein
MFVLGEVIAVFIVNPVVNGERTRPVGLDQGNQADPFDDFVLIAAPLEIGQCNLLGIDFIDDGIVQNKPAGSSLDKGFNFQSTTSLELRTVS